MEDTTSHDRTSAPRTPAPSALPAPPALPALPAPPPLPALSAPPALPALSALRLYTIAHPFTRRYDKSAGSCTEGWTCENSDAWHWSESNSGTRHPDGVRDVDRMRCEGKERPRADRRVH